MHREACLSTAGPSRRLPVSRAIPHPRRRRRVLHGHRNFLPIDIMRTEHDQGIDLRLAGDQYHALVDVTQTHHAPAMCRHVAQMRMSPQRCVEMPPRTCAHGLRLTSVLLKPVRLVANERALPGATGAWSARPHLVLETCLAVVVYLSSPFNTHGREKRTRDSKDR